MIRLIVAVICVIPLSLLAQTPKLIFNIQPDDQEFLRYFIVYNSFDSTAVGIEFGELSIGSGNTWQRVYLESGFDGRTVKGSDAQGVDELLTDFMKTKPFLYSGQDSIRLFRLVYVNMERLNRDYWTTYVGNILDDQSFTLEIVDFATGQRASVIDSIFIGANPRSQSIPHLAQMWDKLFIQQKLNGLESGKKYFARMIPYRNGPTPLGMTATLFGAPIALSYMLRLHDSTIFAIPKLEYDSLIAVYNDSALAFIEKYVDTAGIPPNMNGLYLSNELRDTVYNRYYDSVVVGDSWMYVPKESLLLKAGKPLPSKTNRPPTKQDSYKYITLRVSPNPRTSGDITVQIDNVNIPMQAEVRIVDMQGRILASKNTSLLRGKNGVLLNIAETASESEIVVLLDSSGNVIKTQTLVYQR